MKKLITKMMVDDNLNLRQLAPIYGNSAAVAAGGGISGYESTTIFGMLVAIAAVALHQPAAVASRCVRTPEVTAMWGETTPRILVLKIVSCYY